MNIEKDTSWTRRKFMVLLALVGIMMSVNAQAGCGYVYVDGKPHWVCN